ncbi:hypothetical protein EYF80_053392 [Liparis tanakae]|uniref:Uncharacterized protein n=1 Tax=Liparis tanakae TaxID=230148 RepID=A0A4Z2F6H3_9TELE|nr:hypothetical protein EYF80_053392 [Liparis tanakae]
MQSGRLNDSRRAELTLHRPDGPYLIISHAAGCSTRIDACRLDVGSRGRSLLMIRGGACQEQQREDKESRCAGGGGFFVWERNKRLPYYSAHDKRVVLNGTSVLLQVSDRSWFLLLGHREAVK